MVFNNMTKTELISAVSEKSGLSKKNSDIALTALMDVITETLVSGSDINIVGFGKLSVSEHQARDGRNPKTGEPLRINASKSVKFKCGKGLKDQINN